MSATMTPKPAAALLALALLAAAPRTSFRDATPSSGIAFVLRNASTPERHQIETMLGGIAAFDCDNDGKPDVYFTNGARQPQLDKATPDFYNRLYRNKGDAVFEDITDKAGVRGEGYSMAAATADYDNDGNTDIFVAGVNRNLLYRNKGGCIFEDVTAKAGFPTQGPQPWAVAAAWLDYDLDGDLDLFLVHYTKWNPATEPFCGDPRAGYRTYCHPKYYEGLPNRLYRNEGNGAFTDVSAASNIGRSIGKGMGIAVADYDADGDPDVFITNDAVPNFLFRNEGNGTFKEAALEAGVAFNDDGRALSSMGVDFKDIDNDGREDILTTALANETFPLYRNIGKGHFADITYPTRLGALTLPLGGWGVGIVDIDNDGWKDIFVANSDVNDNTEVFSSRKSRLPATVFLNGADGKFTMEAISAPALHRGAAFADFNGDGRLDVALSRINAPAAILLNESGARNSWLSVRLRGVKSNRDGLGTKLKLTLDDGRTLYNHATTAVGYASSSDRTVHFGLGKAKPKELEITWPTGRRQRVAALPVNQVVDLTEGL
ncbi:MAG: CRTAC1 family protein [Bryobacteraceae bacterium]|nr:CRTAC1 family protein [Bryobacteraceae bacterium]